MRQGAAALAVGSIIAAGCAGSGDPVPDALVDGSPIRNVPVELKGLAVRAVLTSVTVRGREELAPGSLASSCLANARDDGVRGPVVVRTGVDAESVTFRSSSARGLYACDNSRGEREGDRSMCGVAFGQLVDERLRDPRLDLGVCTTKDGTQLGFAWVDVSAATRYVAVEQGGYVEVYETAGGLPVRVTTRQVVIEKSRATFRVSEHAANGKLIRRYRLDAAVAG